MMKTINATKMVRGLFRPVNKQSFCMYWAPLDPRKHNTMNHNPHNMYLDRWEYGQYEDWVLNCSAPPRTYEPQVIDIIAKSLSEQLGTQVTADLLNSKRNRSWSRLLSKDLNTNKAFHEVYPSILARLARDIIVKESRFTWVLEQKIRFDYTMSSFDGVESPVTVQDFLDKYNEDIELVVLSSNLGFAPEIDQAESALEKHEAQEQQLSSPGVAELRNLDKQHDNVINRLLALIH